MNKPNVVETGALKDGTVVYRSVCPICKVYGIWHKDLSIADRVAATHMRTVHAEKAVA